MRKFVASFTAAIAIFVCNPANAATNTLSATASPMWQTNGAIWAMEVVGHTLYVGGSFTSIRPPNSALGHNEIARLNIAAFDTITGQPTNFAPEIPSADVRPNRPAVYRIKKSSDNTRIYVAGDFTTVNNVRRVRVAAFETATGALDPNFVPTAPTGPVYGLTVDLTGVYLGGAFTRIGSVSSPHLAKLSTTGQYIPWATADQNVYALDRVDSRVIVGGTFDYVDNLPRRALASVDAISGAVSYWYYAQENANSAVKDITHDQYNIYTGNEGTGSGVFDGRSAFTSTGHLIWQDGCLGATQAVIILHNFLYSGSHAHDCSHAVNGFPQTSPPKRLLAQDTNSGAIENWFPNTNGGPWGTYVGPDRLGPRALATDGTNLYVGGQFTEVNNQQQQSLTKFGVN